MSELRVVEKWLYDTLSNGSIGATGGVYGDIAMASTDEPYVVYTYLAGRDMIVTSGLRIWSECRYLVRAIGAETYFGALDTISDAIDALIDKAHGVVLSDGIILSCLRQEPFTLTEQVNGIQYRHRGGIYQLRIN